MSNGVNFRELALDLRRQLTAALSELAACRVAVENCEVFRARIVELESQYQRDVFGLNNEGDPIGGDTAGGYANDNARLRAELAALKAQDTVGEVVGWYRLDRPYEMTSYPSVCATWHKLGAPVAPLYAAPAADAWIQVSERLPESERTVLAFYNNSHGKSRRVRAEYIAHMSKGADDGWDGDADAYYDEATDESYWPAGWYEVIDNWDDLTHMVIHEGEVSHWMPLPAGPAAHRAKGWCDE